MGGSKAEADGTGLCRAARGFSGKPLRLSVSVRLAVNVANNASVEGEEQRRFGRDGLVSDYVVAS